MPSPGIQKKNKKWYQKLFPLKKKSSPSKPKKNRIDTCVRLVIRPLRIFQFLVVLLIFVLIIYTIMLTDPKLSSVMCILLIVLSGIYLFVLSIDLINQFMGDEPHTIPMFIFSFLGSLLFGAAGIFLLAVHTSSAPWYILTIAFVSLFAWILFIIDVSLIMAFWKRNCNLCQQCCYSNQTKLSRPRDDYQPLGTETVKSDLTTSVSSVKIPSGDENAAPDHSRRKIREGNRRQYIDCPTSARELKFADAADIQTEIHDTMNVHSQTEREMKEAPVQTVSKCELCNRQIQIFPSSTGTVQSTNQQNCAPCPGLVQLLSGTPCCPGCRCVTSIIQVSQQSQQRQTQRLKRSKEEMEPTKDRSQSADEKPGDMLTSNEHRPQDPKVTGTVTKVTLASYCMPSKKTNASSQTNPGETAKTMSINDRKNNEHTAKRLKASSAEKRDAKKKNETSTTDKAKEKPMDSATKKVNKSSARRVSESAAEKPMENSKQIAMGPSQGSSTKEVSQLSAEKPMESSEKELSGNPTKNPAESSKENVPQNSKDKNRSQGTIKKEVSESLTEEPDGGSIKNPSKNPNNSSTAKQSKIGAKNESFSSDKSSEGNHGEKTNAAGSKKIFSSPGSLIRVIHRPKEPNKDGDTIEVSSTSTGVKMESKTNRDHSEGKHVTMIVKPNTSDKKIPMAALSISKLRIHSTDSDVSMSSNDASGLLASSKKTLDNGGKVSDDGSKNETARSDLSTTTKTERSQETDEISKPDTGTQTIVDPRHKRTYGFRRKNKVEPGGTTHAEMDIQTVDDTDTNKSPSKSQTETTVLKKPGTADDSVINICSSCKKIQMPPTSSSFQYYNIHRDKRGRIYCEHCAVPNSVLYKKEDQKYLKCAGCGQSLRIQSSKNFQSKSDNCSNCGQVQVRVQSAVST